MCLWDCRLFRITTKSCLSPFKNLERTKYSSNEERRLESILFNKRSNYRRYYYFFKFFNYKIMKEVTIKVLWSGCPTCKALYNKVLEIVQKIDPDLEVEYSTDITKIVELGAMSSPVFAINNQVITAGKIPSEDEIKSVILETLAK